MTTVGIVTSVLGVALYWAQSQPATLYVANNGVDSTTCGAQTEPCRSIGQAIFLASADDTILVGPGMYGNLTAGFNYLAPGEEPGGAACGSTRGVICVDKRLTIQSTDGAAATQLEVRSAVLLANGLTIGGEKKGFTFAMGEVVFPSGTNGNTFTGNAVSRGRVDVNGSGHTFRHNTIGAGRSYTDIGASLHINGTSHSFDRNAITNTGIDIFGSSHSLTNNYIIKASFAIVLHAAESDDRPVASDIRIEGNSFVGNVDDTMILQAGSTAVISKNNIFGNAINVPPLNCAIHNRSGNVIDATNNFWGASSGPGSEPADTVCDDGASATTVAPFATQQFVMAASGGGSGGENGSPVCNAAQAVPALLWPANNQFVRVSIIGIGDPDNDPVAISVTEVTQDEAVSGLEFGDSGPDAVILGSSTDIRAQRLGGGNGRVYQLKFSASDGKGGTCTGAVSVGVPNSQRPGQVIVDDGQAYDSTKR